MSLRSAPARGADIIVSGAVGALRDPVNGCNAVLADSDITATGGIWSDGTPIPNGYVFQRGYNPIGVRQVTYTSTTGSLWALYQ